MFKRISIAVVAALIPTVAIAAAPASAASMSVCRDSNGSRPGGSVYVVDGRALGCDLVAPQRLHVTRVASAESCADMGGHGWTPRARVCWDVDA